MTRKTKPPEQGIERGGKRPAGKKKLWESKQTAEEQALMLALVNLQHDLFEAGLVATSLHIQETQRVAGEELGRLIAKRQTGARRALANEKSQA